MPLECRHIFCTTYASYVKSIQDVEEVRSQRDNLTRRLTETTALLQESQNVQQTLITQIERTSADLDSFKASKQGSSGFESVQQH